MTPSTNRKLETKYGATDINWNYDDFSVTFKIYNRSLSFSELDEIRRWTRPKNMTMTPRMDISNQPYLYFHLSDVNFVTA